MALKNETCFDGYELDVYGYDKTHYMRDLEYISCTRTMKTYHQA